MIGSTPRHIFVKTIALDGHIQAEGTLRYLTKKMSAVKFRARIMTELRRAEFLL